MKEDYKKYENWLYYFELFGTIIFLVLGFLLYPMVIMFFVIGIVLLLAFLKETVIRIKKNLRRGD